MRRLSSIAWIGAAAAALVVCLLMVALWAASYIRPMDQTPAHAGWGFRSLAGRFEIIYRRSPVPGMVPPPHGLPPGYPLGPHQAILIEHWYPLGQIATMNNYIWPVNTTIHSTGLYIRYSLLTILAGMMTVAAGLLACRNHRAHVRSIRGLCRICGYDLRASPDRCPECGAQDGPLT